MDTWHRCSNCGLAGIAALVQPRVPSFFTAPIRGAFVFTSQKASEAHRSMNPITGRSTPSRDTSTLRSSSAPPYLSANKSTPFSTASGISSRYFSRFSSGSVAGASWKSNDKYACSTAASKSKPSVSMACIAPCTAVPKAAL